MLSPILILVQGAIVHRLPLFGPESIITRLYFTDLIVLFVYPIGALAVFSVKRWGWYLFLGASAVLIGYNVFVYTLSPRYNLPLLILYNLALAVVSGIFFRKHVIAPYFNPRLRWWETEPRYGIDIAVDILRNAGALSAQLLDISESGCFLTTDHKLRVGRTYSLHIRCMQLKAAVSGKVMRTAAAYGAGTTTGYGMMFVGMNEEHKRQLYALVATLERGGLRNAVREGAEQAKRPQAAGAPRYIVTSKTVLSGDGSEHACTLLDLSKHGCLIATGDVIEHRMGYRMSIECMNHSVSLDACITRHTAADGEQRYGVSFLKRSKPVKRELKKILHSLRKIGASNRLAAATPVGEEVIDRSVQRTPYRSVLFFKRLLRNLRV
jgi:c-di-GMP-binding flagellar brake protein YcgR